MNIKEATTEEIYQYIGQSIVDCIDDDWSEAWIRAEIEDDNGAISGRYKNRAKPEQVHHFRPKSGLFAFFEEIRTRLSSGNRDLWKVARFWISRDGDFNLDLEYEDAARWRDY